MEMLAIVSCQERWGCSLWQVVHASVEDHLPMQCILWQHSLVYLRQKIPKCWVGLREVDLEDICGRRECDQNSSNEQILICICIYSEDSRKRSVCCDSGVSIPGLLSEVPIVSSVITTFPLLCIFLLYLL